MTLIPKTRSGKWSVGLCTSFIVFIGILFVLIAGGQRGGVKFFDNLALALPTLFAGISAIAGLFVGLVSVAKHRERALLTFLAVVIGGFVLYFTIGELLSPH